MLQFFLKVGNPTVVKAKQHLKQEIKKFLLFAKNDMNFMNFSFVMLVMFIAVMYFKLSTKGTYLYNICTVVFPLWKYLTPSKNLSLFSCTN